MIQTINGNAINGKLYVNTAMNKMENSPMGLKDQIQNIFRNWAIDGRINKLSQSNGSVPDWASLSDAEKEKHIRGIISLRHAIDRMKKLKR